MTNRVGICSWSLQAPSPEELVERVGSTGLQHLQLHLDPVLEGTWSEPQTAALLAGSGLTVVSGMMSMKGEDYSSLAAISETGGVRPDATWEANLAAARGNAALARRLGLDLVSFHAGFLPHDPADPERAVLLERLRAVVDAFADQGVRTAFETGQERAGTLLAVLEEIDRDTVGVNFDPANMILYNMGEPVESLELLAPWVRQIHIKDATRTLVPGEWGTEVPAGTGEVDWAAFFGIVRSRELDVDLVIEREAGGDRIGDVRTARALIEHYLEGAP